MINKLYFYLIKYFNYKKYINFIKNPLASFLFFLNFEKYKKLDVKYKANPYKGTINKNSLKIIFNFLKSINKKLNDSELKDFISELSLEKYIDYSTKKTLSNIYDLKVLNNIEDHINYDAKNISIIEFIKNAGLTQFYSEDHCKKLSFLFKSRSSDKATVHDYYKIYQPIIDYELLNFTKKDSSRITIGEIGLGTNNIKQQSNMGLTGIPGASARAFRDYSDKINYIGGDIDKNILFKENRIRTLFVDQIELDSLENFISQNKFNLLIDDGLHTLHSNLNFLSIALKNSITNKCSWIIIEDIDPRSSKIYQTILKYFKMPYKGWVLKTKAAVVCIIHKCK